MENVLAGQRNDNNSRLLVITARKRYSHDTSARRAVVYFVTTTIAAISIRCCSLGTFVSCEAPNVPSEQRLVQQSWFTNTRIGSHAQITSVHKVVT